MHAIRRRGGAPHRERSDFTQTPAKHAARSSEKNSRRGKGAPAGRDRKKTEARAHAHEFETRATPSAAEKETEGRVNGAAHAAPQQRPCDGGGDGDSRNRHRRGREGFVVCVERSKDCSPNEK